MTNNKAPMEGLCKTKDDLRDVVMTDISGLAKLAQGVSAEFLKDYQTVKSDPSPAKVEELRVHYLGRKGQITALMEALRDIAKEQRPEAGKIVNELRQAVEGQISELKLKAHAYEITGILDAAEIDISLPTNSRQRPGSLHPVSLMLQSLINEFRRLGFTVMQGPEIDLDYYNFSALNFKEDHPARDMQDTFFVEGYDKTILRTHTSNIQVHTMLSHRPPLRVVALGRTFRCDSDLTHTPMFHQIEGFIVDRNISMGDLKGVIDQFLKAIFGQDLSTRLRPSYFPFVEPGGEVDLQCVSCRGAGCRICKETGWLEVGGLGMIHPNVFEAVNYDSETYTGFAFGFGIDRLAMLKYGIKDLRVLFEGNLAFAKQFNTHSV